VRAQVTAELDFTRTEQARETYAPNPDAIRSEQIIEEQGVGLDAQGVPGALSNQPPGGSVVPETLGELDASGEADAGAERSRRQATRNFELDRIVDHTVTPRVSIRRLSVAVVIDDRKSVDAEGNVQSEGRGEEEMARITALVKEAIGFDEARGDRVNVVNAAFTTGDAAASEPLPAPPLLERPWVLDVGKQVAGALVVLILGLGVLRPLMRSLINRDLAERELMRNEGSERLALTNESGGAALGVEGRPALALGGQDTPVDAIRALVSQDPKRVANMVKNWVDGNG
jgi:flagellar M-ring protein FliF